VLHQGWGWHVESAPVRSDAGIATSCCFLSTASAASPVLAITVGAGFGKTDGGLGAHGPSRRSSRVPSCRSTSAKRPHIFSALDDFVWRCCRVLNRLMWLRETSRRGCTPPRRVPAPSWRAASERSFGAGVWVQTAMFGRVRTLSVSALLRLRLLSNLTEAINANPFVPS
jgi:hypothetical protein